MSLSITIGYVPEATLEIVAKRSGTALYVDFADGVLRASPAVPRASLTLVEPMGDSVYELIDPRVTDADFDIAVYDSTTGAFLGMASTTSQTSGGSGGSGADVDERIYAWAIGRVSVDPVTKIETYYHRDNSTLPVCRGIPDGAGGRLTEDLRGS